MENGIFKVQLKKAGYVSRDTYIHALEVIINVEEDAIESLVAEIRSLVRRVSSSRTGGFSGRSLGAAGDRAANQVV